MSLWQSKGLGLSESFKVRSLQSFIHFSKVDYSVLTAYPEILSVLAEKFPEQENS